MNCQENFKNLCILTIWNTEQIIIFYCSIIFIDNTLFYRNLEQEQAALIVVVRAAAPCSRPAGREQGNACPSACRMNVNKDVFASLTLFASNRKSKVVAFSIDRAAEAARIEERKSTYLRAFCAIFIHFVYCVFLQSVL